jgi:hypothetical protein
VSVQKSHGHSEKASNKLMMQLQTFLTVVSVESVGFAVALIGPYVCFDGCRVWSFLDKVINGQLDAVAGL